MNTNTKIKNLRDLGFPQHCIYEDGKVYSLNSNKYLKTQLCEKGYHKITLYHNKKRKTFLLHRLVALSFLDLPENYEDLEVNHKDGDKSNNNVINLEWATSLDNIKHAISCGLRNSNYKLTEKDVHTVCRLLQEGFRNYDIANIVGISKSHVSSIKTRRCYPEIVSEYDISFVEKKARISLDKIISICELLQEGFKDYQIAKKLNVNHRVVGTIRKRLTHTSVSVNYKW